MYQPKKVTLHNKRLYDLLVKKGEWITKGRSISGEIEKQQTELNKCGLQIQKYKDKIVPLVEQEAAPHLTGPFEDIGGVDIKDDAIELTIIDVSEERRILLDKYLYEFQEEFLKKKAEKNN